MSGYVAMPTPVTANPQFWNQGLEGLNALRDYQAKQATAQIYQQSIDPSTGQIDQGKFNALLAANPRAAWNAGQTMQQQGAAQSAQAVGGTNQVARASAIYNMAGTAAASIGLDPSDANIARVRGGLVTAGAPQQVLDELDRISAIPDQGQRKLVAYQHTLALMDAQHRMAVQGYPTPAATNVGGQIVPVGVTPPTPYSPGGIAQGPGSVTTTASPDTIATMPDAIVKATADDVKAGLASTPGQEIRISGAERIRRYGYTGLLPPGAREVPVVGGGGGGVVNSDGTPVSVKPPRLLNTPGSPNPAPSPAPAPAPTGGPPAAPATGGSVGFGAAIGGPQGAPAAPALPVPPVPPPNAPPAPVPVPAPAPSTANPAIAAAQARAKATGQPAPIPGMQGMVANPNGTIGPPAGGGFGRPGVNAPVDSMTPGPRAALQGGVPVASANPLLAPAVGQAGAPSPLVPGDVNAIMQGMANRARGGGVPGTQQAAGGTFAAGPGYDEQVNATTSQERLAADTKIAANYASNVFPYTQALSALGRGMTTAPGSDFLNAAKGFAGGMARSMGFGGTFDSTKDYDELHKWLSQIITNNPVAQGSDARLAATLQGNANTGIHELASADMMKAGIALMRMNATASSEWANNPQVRAQYGYYNDFLRDFNKTIDPRAFAWDMYNPEQKKTLIADLNAHRSDPVYAQKLQDSLAMVRRNGYLGETRAMP